MSSRERWSEVERILDQLLELPPEARVAALENLAGGDAALRAEVCALLEAADRPGLLDNTLERLAGSLLGGEPNPVARVGDPVGRYRIVKVLGRGGMGEVYLAERSDGEFEHRVALKVIRDDPDRHRTAERFRRERQILARLRHPNIASLHDGGSTEDGAPFFVMEYVEGRPITSYADENRLSVDARVRLFESVCKAVSYAHRSLVVHRDLKPSNVLVTSDGTVKLLDFGIAAILTEPEIPDDQGAEEAPTWRSSPYVAGHSSPRSPGPETTRLCLTPAYASPEQLLGRPATVSTDIYTLGVLLYELLTGRHPHEGSGDLVRSVLEREPPSPSTVVSADTAKVSAAAIASARRTAPGDLQRRLRGDLDAIVQKSLRRSPDERYGSAEDLRADLERARIGHPVMARRATRRYRLSRFTRRNRVAVAAGLVLVTSLLAFGVSMSLLYGRSRANLERALEAERTTATEARLAKRVSDFLMDLFRVSNPDQTTWERLTARDILERAVERVNRELGDQPLVRARMLGTLGDTYRGLGRYEEARRLLQEDVELKRRFSNESDPNYATALNNYGIVLTTLGEYGEALQVHREALSIRERRLGAGHPDVAQSLSNLGTAYAQLGKLDSSLVCHERALAIKREVLGPDDDGVASAAFNLGALLLKRGDRQRALVHFEEARRVWEHTRGARHPTTVRAVAASAGVMHLEGDSKRARELQRRVLADLESSLGPEHAEVGDAALNLATIERTLGNVGDALALQERALGIYERAYGHEHPRVAEALFARAQLERETGNATAARTLAEGGLSILEHAKVANGLTVDLLHELGRIERELGRNSAASSYDRRALDLSIQVFGPDHDVTTELRRELGAPR